MRKLRDTPGIDSEGGVRCIESENKRKSWIESEFC